MPGSWPRSSIKERIFLDKLLSRIIFIFESYLYALSFRKNESPCSCHLSIIHYLLSLSILVIYYYLFFAQLTLSTYLAS